MHIPTHTHTIISHTPQFKMSENDLLYLYFDLNVYALNPVLGKIVFLTKVHPCQHLTSLINYLDMVEGIQGTS